MRFVRKAGCALALMLAGTSCWALPAAFEGLLRAYERAWMDKDTAGLAALFADEGMALPNGQPPARGADAIAAAYEKGVGSPLVLKAIAHGESGELGYIIGSFGVTAEGPAFGKFVLLLRRGTDGRWRILADMDNPNAMPRRAAAPAAAASKP